MNFEKIGMSYKLAKEEEVGIHLRFAYSVQPLVIFLFQPPPTDLRKLLTPTPDGDPVSVFVVLFLMLFFCSRDSSEILLCLLSTTTF